jgi:hypothetical protein
MRSIELIYWIQGFMEIAGDVKSINEKRTIIIKNHLNLVFTYEKNPSGFCYWLKGFFDSGITEFDAHQTLILKDELMKIFTHVIDQSYTSDPIKQQEMNDTHDGVMANYDFLTKPPFLNNEGDNVNYRC